MTLYDIEPTLHRYRESLTIEWLQDPRLTSFFTHNGFDSETFRQQYGNGIFDYFCEVAKGNEKTGRCPILESLLRFFWGRSVPFEDIFFLCECLKKRIILFIMTIPGSGFTPIEETLTIFMENFAHAIQTWRMIQDNHDTLTSLHQDVKILSSATLCEKNILSLDRETTGNKEELIIKMAEIIKMLSTTLYENHHEDVTSLGKRLGIIANRLIEQSEAYAIQEKTYFYVECLACDIVTWIKNSHKIEGAHLLSSLNDTLIKLENLVN